MKRRPAQQNALLESLEKAAVQRTAISDDSKEAYRNATSVAEKCDILFEILTGEEP